MIAWFWPFLMALRSWRMRVQRAKKETKPRHGRGGPAHHHQKKEGLHEHLGLDGPGIEFVDIPNRVLSNLAEPYSYTRMSAEDDGNDSYFQFNSPIQSAHNRAQTKLKCPARKGVHHDH